MPRQTRGNRKKQIVAVLHAWEKHHDYRDASSHQIAHAIGVRPSTYLNNMLWELADEGMIVPTPGETVSGATRFTWRVKASEEAVQQYFHGMYVPLKITDLG